MAPQRAGRDITKQMLRHRQMVLDQMDFKQKAEEKKMSMSKNIARLAVTAGLTAALSFGGVMAPVTMAFADEGDNSITITQSDGNESTRFKAYQIFRADVVDPTEEGAIDKIVSNVEWADGVGADAQKAIIDAIKNSQKYESSKNKLSDNNVTPQSVADWLTANITKTDKTTVVGKDDLLNQIAGIVKDKVNPTGNSFAADSAFVAPSTGYYLFLTDVDSIGTKDKFSDKKQTGTSPIFAVVGDSAVTVAEKTKIPTVEKKIKDDKPRSDWADKGDSQMDQPVHYQLTGTVAANIDTFNTYYYEFHDELSAGLTADKNSITVAIDGATVTAASNYTTSVVDTTDESGAVTGQVLTVSFTDLKAAAQSVNKTLTKDSKVVVTYTAKLDHEKAKNVKVGGEGNPNSVKLIYSNNPMSDGKGESVPDTVRDYTYALKLVKEDSGTDATKLVGVKFTIQATDTDEGTSTKYVQKNGSLGDVACDFTTDDNGEINIKGLDAGTYTVKETHTLDGYNTLPDFTFTISTADGDLDKTEEQGTTLTVNTTKNGSELVEINGSAESGTVTLTVKNKKGSGLPLTGLNGVTFTWIAGGAVLCIGVAHLIRSRKQAEESEQE